MNAYTPGPWSPSRWGDAYVYTGSTGDGELVAVVYNPASMDHSRLYDHIAVTNARLIAAAPALLEALQAVIRHINNMGRALAALDLLPEFIPQLDEAEAVSFQAEVAIAQALGQQVAP